MMKITGLTIVRNAILNDYPVKESIESVLPVVDEMIVCLDPGEDETEGLIRGISSPKIRIIKSKWDLNKRKGGIALAEETNKGLKMVSTDTDWIFYLQADEVVHEKYHAAIRKAAEKYLGDRKVDGLLFKYLHFYGTYEYVGDSRKWYNCETRIIRNDSSITSFSDAQGFRRNGEKISVAAIDAYVYHYGWVKSPIMMRQKHKIAGYFWGGDPDQPPTPPSAGDVFDFSEFDSLVIFKGTHPSVMQKRISEKNWTLDLDITKKKMSLKNRLLFFIERQTGKRLFAFRNHKVIRK